MRTFLLALAASFLLLAAPAAATPSWLAPINLGAETPSTSSTGRVALGADGTAVAAWAQWVPSGGNWVLQVARRRPGGGFTAPITVPGTTGVETNNTRVGVDGAGNATIMYRIGGALAVIPWPAAAGAPGGAQPLQAGSSPELAVGRNGTAVATWIDNGNVNAPQVRAAVRTGPTGAFGSGNVISFTGNGMNSITGLRAAVGDGGHIAVVWSRTNPVPQTLVEVNERAPGGAFTANGQSISDPLQGTAIDPAVAVGADGRVTALWSNTSLSQVRYAEDPPGIPDWSVDTQASQPGANASTPVADAGPNGLVVAAWVSDSAMQAAARSNGGAFGGFTKLSGPAMTTFSPMIAVGGNGDALIAWNVTDQKALFTVRRTASGAFGPLLTAVKDANGVQNFFEPSLGIDDQGNGVAAWTRDEFRSPTDFYRFQAASFDAAPPALSSSVPPGGKAGAAIPMAAAATDRVSPVSIRWAFGDGTSALGGAVSHVFAAGAFTVTTTATDAAGNQASQTHPVLVAAKRPKRIRSKVRVTWGVAGKRIFLLRMQIVKAPKRSKAELRCADRKKGKQCPFNRTSSKKRKKGTITLFKEIKAKNVIGKQRRTFHAGQTLQVRITKKGYIGKVVRYKLQKGKIPSGKDLCLPPGKKKPRKRC